MNTKNINPGDIFKNYKAICEALGVNPKTGKSKQLQLKDWGRYFTYSKDGYNFIINEIYDTPLEKTDDRGGAHNLLSHSQKMDDTLTYILNSQPNGELFMTMNRLLETMKMINSNYRFGNHNKRKVSNYLNIEEAFVEEFFNITKRTLKSNIESMLNRLESKALIYWYKVKMVCVASSELHTNELGSVKVKYEVVTDDFDNENIKLSTESSEELSYRVATDEEIKLISVIEGKILDELKCKNKQELVVKNRWETFRKRVNEILTDKANIIFYYDSYKILRNEDRLAKVADKVDITSTLCNSDLFGLNEDVQNQLLANATKRNEKSALEFVMGNKNSRNKMRSNHDYIGFNKELIDNFIDSSHENIIDDLKQTKVYRK